MSGRFNRARWYAEHIRARREELGLSKSQLATRAKTNPGLIEQLEQGQGSLTTTGTHRVLEALEIDEKPPVRAADGTS